MNTAAGEDRRRTRLVPSDSDDRRALVAGLLTTLVLSVTLFARQPYLFSEHMIAWGDDAVYAIEIDDAKHLRLIDGNNSRIGTSHPGPAFYYVAGAAEAVLYDGLGVVPEPLNAQRIGNAMLMSVFLGWVVAIFSRRLKPIETFVAAAALVSMLTVLPGLLTGSWLPYLYCAPFMLSTVAAGAILSGEQRAVLPYIIASWFLIQGHVGFILNVGGMSAVLLTVLLTRHRRELKPFVLRHARIVRSGLLVSAVFLLPMVINLILNWPSPWLDYIQYSQTTTKDPRSVGDVLRFVKHFLTWQSQVPNWVMALVAAAIVSLIALLPAGSLRKYSAWSAVACAAAVGIFTVYAAIGIDYLHEIYTGYYILMVPAIAVAIGGAALTRLLRRGAPLTALCALVLAAGTLVRSDTFITSNRGDPQVRTLVKSIKANAQWNERMVVLTFEHAAWPWAVAVMQDGSNNGLAVCAADEYWSWFVTPRFICNDDELIEGWHVSMTLTENPSAVAGPILVRSPSVVLWTPAVP